jgi:PPM family protein phosphatase
MDRDRVSRAPIMLEAARYHYDAALGAAIGRRDLQEDAVTRHFPAGSDLGFVVLADGMGGHAAGDVAARIVVQEVSAELARQAEDPAGLERNVGAILRAAVDRANRQVARHVSDRPDRQTMGATLVATLILGNRLYWISVGDSPLYLLRGSRMSRLNQEHSVARRLEGLVLKGMISRREAEADPDRFCLTSALQGGAVPEIDCRDRPIDLADGDILIVASDGILTLDEARIAALVYGNRDRPSAEISDGLLRDIRAMNDPDQDNVTLCMVKIGLPDAAVLPAASAAAAATVSAAAGPTVSPAVSAPVLASQARRAEAGTRTTLQLRVHRVGDRVIRRFSSVSEREA